MLNKMRKILLFSLMVFAISCARKEKEASVKQLIKTDTAAVKKVGADKDSHDCKTSAGYTWSELKQECVRIFEAGTKLDPSQKDAMAAFIIFEGNKAELFTMIEAKPLILTRKAEGEPWINGDWKLIPWKGYVLKKGEAILFTGK